MYVSYNITIVFLVLTENAVFLIEIAQSKAIQSIQDMELNDKINNAPGCGFKGRHREERTAYARPGKFYYVSEQCISNKFL